MSSDLFALSALADELNIALAGARIDKIQQPENDELRIFVRTTGKNLCLCISCNSGAPRIHLTSSKKPSPQTAPSLCMLLRKYLSSSNIESVSIFGCDRIVQVKFVARTEMRDNAVFYLFVEIMNRYSNIIFTDENLTILDSVKRMSIDDNAEHIVMRGVKYLPVLQPKISYLNNCFSIFDNFAGGDLQKYILDNISGFSSITVSEILARTGIKGNLEGALSAAEKDSLKSIINTFRNIRTSDLYSPSLIGAKDVYPFPYSVLTGGIKTFETLSEAYDNLYTASDAEIRNKARLKSLNNVVKRLRQKVEKNINIDNERLLDCENMDKYKLFGELIVSNIYKIKRGDKKLSCLNYYDNTEIEIPLDERLSPSKNSAANYNKYNKLKRTKEFTEGKIIEDKNLLLYVSSIEQELSSLPFDAPTTSIEQELEKLGAIRIKTQKGKVRKEKSEPPYTYFYDGFTILRGRNNLQNDELTFKIASACDLWLHMKNLHGTHTIILTEGKPVPENVLQVASEIASCTATATVEVDYTERRNVKRQPNGHPGQVIYVNYKTVLAVPNLHLELLVK
ncbi:MAG: NFACT RNA binding domain-containing protein [Clostridia bacterium]